MLSREEVNWDKKFPNPFNQAVSEVTAVAEIVENRNIVNSVCRTFANGSSSVFSKFESVGKRVTPAKLE